MNRAVPAPTVTAQTYSCWCSFEGTLEEVQIHAWSENAERGGDEHGIEQQWAEK